MEEFNTSSLDNAYYIGSYEEKSIYTEFGNSGGFGVDISDRMMTASLMIAYHNLNSVPYVENQNTQSYILFFFYNTVYPLADDIVPDANLGGIHVCIYTSGVVTLFREGNVIHDVYIEKLIHMNSQSLTVTCEWQERSVNIVSDGELLLKYIDKTVSVWNDPNGKHFGCFFESKSSDARIHGVSSYSFSGEKLHVFINSNILFKKIDVTNDIYIDNIPIINKNRGLSNIQSLSVSGISSLNNAVFGLDNGNEIHGRTVFHEDVTMSNNKLELLNTLSILSDATMNYYTVFGRGGNKVYGISSFMSDVNVTDTLYIGKGDTNRIQLDSVNNVISGSTTFKGPVKCTSPDFIVNQLIVDGPETSMTTFFKYPNNRMFGTTCNMGPFYADKAIRANEGVEYSELWASRLTGDGLQHSLDYGEKSVMVFSENKCVINVLNVDVVDGHVTTKNTSNGTYVSLFHAGLKTASKVVIQNDTDDVSRFEHNTVDGETVISGLLRSTSLQVGETTFTANGNRVIGDTIYGDALLVEGGFEVVSNSTFKGTVKIKDSVFGEVFGNVIVGNTSVNGSFSNMGVSWFGDSMRVESDASFDRLLIGKDDFVGKTEINGSSNIIYGQTYVYGNLINVGDFTASVVTVNDYLEVSSSDIFTQNTILGSNNRIVGDTTIIGETIIQGSVNVNNDILLTNGYISHDNNEININTKTIRFKSLTNQNAISFDTLSMTMFCSNVNCNKVTANEIAVSNDGLLLTNSIVNNVVVNFKPLNNKLLSLYTSGTKFGIRNDGIDWLTVNHSIQSDITADINGDINVVGNGNICINGDVVITNKLEMINMKKIQAERFIQSSIYHCRVYMHTSQLQPMISSTVFVTSLLWDSTQIPTRLGNIDQGIKNNITEEHFIDNNDQGTSFHVPVSGLWCIKVFVKFSDPYVHGNIAMFKNTSDVNEPRNSKLAMEHIPSGSDMVNISTHSYLEVNDNINILLSTTELSLGSFNIDIHESYIDVTLLIQE